MAIVKESFFGSLQIVNSTADITNPFVNKIIIDKSDGLVKLWDGTQWVGGASGKFVMAANAEALPEASGYDNGTPAVTEDNGVVYYVKDGEWVNSADLYFNDMPTTVNFEGLPAGTTFENGVTLGQFIELLCYKEVNATVSKATAKIAPSGFTNGQQIEVGTQLTVGLTTSFNSKGSIAPQYEEGTGKKLSNSVAWAGDATSYSFTGGYSGTKTVGTDAEATATSCTVNVGSVSVPFATTTYTSNISYASSGYNAYTSKGNLQETNNGGTTSNVSCSFTGVLPWFCTSASINTLTRQSSNITPSSSNVQIGSGGTGLADEAGGGGYKQAFLIPASWYTGSTVKWSQYNPVSGAWDQYTSNMSIVSDAVINWETMQVTANELTYTISGTKPVDTTNQQYKFIINTDVTTGPRSVRIIK